VFFKRNKKYFSIVLLVFIIIFAFQLSCNKKSENYNLIIITIDTLRADRVSLYDSSHVKTPSVDSIGKDGIFFKYAFANVPVTLPSHTGIMTGLYPPSHGVRDNSGYIVNKKLLTLAEYLKKYDYKTGAFIGAFPLDSRFGLDQGFDVYDDNYGTKNPNDIFFVERKAEKVIDLAIKWIGKRDKKWFSWIHLFDPHQPYNPPEPFKSKFKNDLYSGEVAYVDSQLKRLFNYLKKTGKYKNTIIIITADHGEGLGEHGEKTHAYFAYNSTIHIPLIIKYPGEKFRGKEIKDYVTHVDIFPTVCEILGLKIPKNVEGVSLYKLMEGKEKNIKERLIYFESLPPYLNRGWAPLKGFIDSKRKIKYIDQPIPEIYDLKNDFNELKNIADSKSSFAEKRRLETLLRMFKPFSKQKRGKVSSSEMRKLQSLGYLSSSVKFTKVGFSKRDDLKVLLPLQNKMLEGLGLYSKGDYVNSLRILSEVVKERKDFVLVWNKIANIFKESGKPDLAMATYEKALEFNKDNYNLLLNYGAFLAEYGISDRALEILNRAKRIRDYDPELWNAIGVAYWKSGEVGKAIECFDKALSFDSNDAIVYSNKGAMFLSFLIYDRAEKNLKKALRIDPKLVSALNSYAALLKKRGSLDKAILNWEKIINIDKNFYMAYYNLMAVYLDRGEYKKALSVYERARENGLFNHLTNKQKLELEKLYTEIKNALDKNN